MNSIVLKKIETRDNKVFYDYSISGKWSEYFNLNNRLFIEYDGDVSKVPDSVLSIPFICDFLPMVWICNAEICVEAVDEDFANNMQQIKQGYIDMYPTLKFLGKMSFTKIEKNKTDLREKTGAFFSGGVDAYTTLFRHMDKKPRLITIWGADVKLSNQDAWSKVEHHILSVAKEYALDVSVIKSNFREVIYEEKLDDLVSKSLDGWWHGFQHGIALISHAAPLAYMYGLSEVFIASSFPERMKGKYTCASDPTIDNYVSFCGCNTIHDGYELDRQEKIRYLVEQQNNDNVINLRVCWQSSAGNNCCRCEKCYRTILEIVSEGGNPNDYGFIWNSKDIKRCKKDLKNKCELHQDFVNQYYPEIQRAIRLNQIKDHEEYEWLKTFDFAKFNEFPIKKIRRGIRHILSKIRSIL